MTESLDENMRGMGDPADYDAWARETPEAPAERLELLPDYSPIVMMEPTVTTVAAADPDEYVPCPRHGTRCFREIPYLRDRIECAIGLYGSGPKGPGEATDRILMMIEDHIVRFASSLAVRIGT